MAVQIPDPGTGNGQTGDNEYVFRKKVKDNFSDQTNAASRLVGGAVGNIPDVKVDGLGSSGYMGVMRQVRNGENADALKTGFYYIEPSAITGNDGAKNRFCMHVAFTSAGGNSRGFRLLNIPYTSMLLVQSAGADGLWKAPVSIYSQDNVTKDANGFLKAASPVVDMYDDNIVLNNDATEQGGITFEKLGTGDYLVKGSLGFAQEGWYIETPKDANGNILVAVVYEQLENNDISIKTYAKRFDDETGDIVANLAKPRDIPDGRFISLRLHELPKEPPVMPMSEPTTEV